MTIHTAPATPCTAGSSASRTQASPAVASVNIRSTEDERRWAGQEGPVVNTHRLAPSSSPTKFCHAVQNVFRRCANRIGVPCSSFLATYCLLRWAGHGLRGKGSPCCAPATVKLGGNFREKQVHHFCDAAQLTHTAAQSRLACEIVPSR